MSCLITTESEARSEHKAFWNFWGWPKKDEMHKTYTSGTDSLSFWLIRQSTNILPTMNGRRICRVSPAISTEISAGQYIITRPICWLTCVDWYISVVMSIKCQTICWPTYQSSVGRYVDRYIGRVLVDMSTDISVEGCTKYTWSKYNYHQVLMEIDAKSLLTFSC